MEKLKEDLPKGWEQTNLENVACILDYLRIPVNNVDRQRRLEHAEVQYPYYGATGQVGYIDDYLFEGEAILLGEDGAPFLDPMKGKAYLVNEKYWVNNHAHILRGYSGVENRFLKHQLNAISYRPFVSGTTRLKLTQASLKKIPLKIAPLNEQKCIVDKIDRLFSDLDEGEALLKLIQKQIVTYRQSVLKAAVIGDWTKCDRSKWKKKTIGDLLTNIRYGTAKKCVFDESKTPVLRIPNVIGGKVDLNNLKHTDFTETEIEKLQLEEGDILIVRSNGSVSLVGLSAVVDKCAVGFAYAGYLIRIRLRRDLILPDFLNIYLHSPVVRSRIEIQARSTSGVHNINSSEVKSIPISLPTMKEQEAIVSLVNETFSRIDALEDWCKTELKRSAALRQAILKDAFSGKLVSQDPNDEPAAELLARIKKSEKSKKVQTKKKVCV